MVDRSDSLSSKSLLINRTCANGCTVGLIYLFIIFKIQFYLHFQFEQEQIKCHPDNESPNSLRSFAGWNDDWSVHQGVCVCVVCVCVCACARVCVWLRIRHVKQRSPTFFVPQFAKWSLSSSGLLCLCRPGTKWPTDWYRPAGQGLGTRWRKGLEKCYMNPVCAPICSCGFIT